MRPPNLETLEIGTLLDRVRDGVIVADAANNGTIVLWNPAASEIFGYPPSQAVGMNVDRLIPECLKERHRAGILRYRDTGYGPYIDSQSVLQLPALRKDGKEISIELTLSPITPDGAEAAEGRFVLAIVRDVTQLKKAEEEARRLNKELEERIQERTTGLRSALTELSKSEERSRLLVENVRDYAIFMMDPRGRVSGWNVGAERVFDYKEAEIIGKDGSTLFIPEDQARGVPERELKKAAQDGRAEDERWHARKDGTRFWASGVVTPVRDEAGILRGFAKVARDFTERKRAEDDRERLLQESERQANELRTVIESIPDAVYIGDKSGITMCNDAALEMLGFESVEELNQRIHLLAERLQTRYASTGERIPPGEEVFDRALRGETYAREVRVQHLKTGRDMTLRSAAAPIRHEGSVVGAVAVNTDITERKRAEEKLQRSSERIINILESTTDAFLALDKEWRFTYLNRQAEVVLGRKREDLLEKNVWDEYPEAVGSAFHERYHEASASGEPVHFEEFYQPLGVWLEVNIYPSEDGLAVYFRDVTERKHAEEELYSRTLQQAAVAQLGQVALAEDDLQKLMKEAVGLVARTLGLEYCKILELLPDGTELLLRAGVSWKEGLVGRATVGADLHSQAGYTLLSDEPVIVQDLRSESRFSGPPLLHEHGVVSGMSTIIGGREQPFGVLGAHTKEQRIFTEDDVNFLQAVANVLATAIERKRAEEELREQEAIFRSLSASSPVGVFLTDLEGRCTYSNPRCQHICGFSFEEGLGEGWSNFAHPEDRERAFKKWSAYSRQGREYSDEFRFVNPQRGVRWVHVRSLPMFLDGVEPVGHVGTVEDITERKRAEEAVLEVREGERRRIARDLHDVALQDLSAAVQELQALQLQRKDPKLDPQLGRTTNVLRRVAHGLRGAIYDLRSEEGGSFVGALESVVEYNRHRSPECEIILEVAECFPEDLPQEVGVELLRVLQEALTNARRHSKARIVRVSLGLEEGSTLVAEVADDGRGFDPSSTKGGVGIQGMRERASLLRAEMTVRSEPGKGASVRVSLPGCL